MVRCATVVPLAPDSAIVSPAVTSSPTLTKAVSEKLVSNHHFVAVVVRVQQDVLVSAVTPIFEMVPSRTAKTCVPVGQVMSMLQYGDTTSLPDSTVVRVLFG